MPKSLFVIKLGGSVITYKNYPFGKLRLRRVSEIAQEIKQAKKKQCLDLIIVNGAGSFGHPIAKKYGIANGIRNEKQIRGFCETKYSVNLLNIKLNKIFLEAGLNVFPCQTSSLVIQDRGEIFSFSMESIRHLLEQEIIPILSGDVVADISWGGSICSGDAIAPYLGDKLKAKQILFASDVEGIFDRDPHKYKNAKLIREIKRENFSKVIGSIEKSSCIDVTGGMKGKLQKIKNHFHNTEILIFNGLKKDSLLEALLGKKIGTIIDLA